jgi:hypothetical protein
MMLSDGYFWVRRNGGYNFYLGDHGVSSIDFSRPVAACGSVADELTLAGLFEAGEDCWIAITAVGKFGLESDAYAWQRIRTDEALNGHAVPAPVENLRGGLGDFGCLKITWDYRLRPGGPAPSKFLLYAGYVANPVDYLNPVDEVPFRPTRWRYEWSDVSYVDGGPYRAAVRAVTAEGVHDGSYRSVVVCPDSRHPGSIEQFTIEVTQM